MRTRRACTCWGLRVVSRGADVPFASTAAAPVRVTRMHARPYLVLVHPSSVDLNPAACAVATRMACTTMRANQGFPAIAPALGPEQAHARRQQAHRAHTKLGQCRTDIARAKVWVELGGGGGGGGGGVACVNAWMSGWVGGCVCACVHVYVRAFVRVCVCLRVCVVVVYVRARVRGGGGAWRCACAGSAGGPQA